MKNGTFLCKIRNFCTAGITYKVNPINSYESFNLILTCNMSMFPNKY